MRPISSHTDIDLIDEHHSKILSAIELLKATIQGNTTDKSVSQIFYKLSFCIEDYFTEEELLFKKFAYPKLSNLQKEHNLFIEKLNQIRLDYLDGEESVNEKLIKFLTDWVKNTILNYNKECLEFLKAEY